MGCSELGAKARVGAQKKKKETRQRRKGKQGQARKKTETRTKKEKREKQNRPESTRETAAAATQPAQLQQERRRIHYTTTRTKIHGPGRGRLARRETTQLRSFKSLKPNKPLPTAQLLLCRGRERNQRRLAARRCTQDFAGVTHSDNTNQPHEQLRKDTNKITKALRATRPRCAV